MVGGAGQQDPACIAPPSKGLRRQAREWGGKVIALFLWPFSLLEQPLVKAWSWSGYSCQSDVPWSQLWLSPAPLYQNDEFDKHWKRPTTGLFICYEQVSAPTAQCLPPPPAHNPGPGVLEKRFLRIPLSCRLR